jgi:hypothetical protein
MGPIEVFVPYTANARCASDCTPVATKTDIPPSRPSLLASVAGWTCRCPLSPSDNVRQLENSYVRRVPWGEDVHGMWPGVPHDQVKGLVPADAEEGRVDGHARRSRRLIPVDATEAKLDAGPARSRQDGIGGHRAVITASHGMRSPAKVMPSSSSRSQRPSSPETIDETTSWRRLLSEPPVGEHRASQGSEPYA